jgi:hypothetical protein
MTQRVKDLGREQGRLSRDEARTDWPLLVLAVGFVVIHAVQVTAPGLPATAHRLLEALSWGIWPIFAVDLLARVWLAERRWLYLLTHPIDVVVVLLPALRPLRVLRIFAAGQALVSRGGRVSLLRSAQAIAIAAGLETTLSEIHAYLIGQTRQADTGRTGQAPPHRRRVDLLEADPLDPRDRRADRGRRTRRHHRPRGAGGG